MQHGQQHTRPSHHRKDSAVLGIASHSGRMADSTPTTTQGPRLMDANSIFSNGQATSPGSFRPVVHRKDGPMRLVLLLSAPDFIDTASRVLATGTIPSDQGGDRSHFPTNPDEYECKGENRAWAN